MSSAMKVLCGGCASVCLLFVLAGPRALAAESAREGRQEGELHDGQADFDFLIGSWKVHNRRLKKPLAGSTEWYEFEATVVAAQGLGRPRQHRRVPRRDPGGPHRGLDRAPLRPQSGAVEPLLGERREGEAGRAHGRLLQGRPR